MQAATRNFGWLLSDKLLRLILGVGVGFWVARYLGPTQLGTLSYAMAIVTLLGFLPAFGLEPIVKRELLQRPEMSGELLASTMVLRGAAGLLIGGAMALALRAGWHGSVEEGRILWILALLLAQPALLTPDHWLQAHLRASSSVRAQWLALAVGSLLRVVLIFSNASVEAFAAVVVLEMGLNALGIWYVASKAGVRWGVGLATLTTIKRLLREAWPLAFASLAVVVYMRIDEVMLRHMVGVAEVGIYSAAIRLSEVWYFVPVVLGSSVLPALIRAREGGANYYAARMQRYYDLSAAAAYALSLPIALVAPWLIEVAYGESFKSAGSILVVHIWSSVFVFLGVARGQWLVNERLPTFYLLATCGGAVVNVLLNFIFIPRWGGLGAAWATLLSYAVAAWLASYLHPKVREAAAMQTRALLIPFRAWNYFRSQ